MKRQDILCLFAVLLEDPGLTFPCRSAAYEELFRLAGGKPFDLERRLVENSTLRCLLKRALEKMLKASEDGIYNQDRALDIASNLIEEKLMEFFYREWNHCSCTRTPDDSDMAENFAFLKGYVQQFPDAEETLPYGFTFWYQLPGHGKQFKATLNITTIGLTIEVETDLPVVNPLPGVHLKPAKLKTHVRIPTSPLPEKSELNAILEKKAREMLTGIKKG